MTARVLQLIQERRLDPGGRLPSERELALVLRVSRPALRESLATLEAMRMIVRRPNSGIYLAERDSPPSFESVVLRSDLGLPLDREMVVSSAEVRQLLEVHAVELACHRRSDADLSALRAVLAQTRTCLREGNSIIDLDGAFHLGIVAATRNAVFVQIVHAFYRLSRPRRETYFLRPRALPPLVPGARGNPGRDRRPGLRGGQAPHAAPHRGRHAPGDSRRRRLIRLPGA
ncbi:MAG: FadR family transcriptional regulator [Betaproteobacteria bacterium]|nr:FadR family transcriptional regulator [Betaproteobacteria bacterium]